MYKKLFLVMITIVGQANLMLAELPAHNYFGKSVAEIRVVDRQFKKAYKKPWRFFVIKKFFDKDEKRKRLSNDIVYLKKIVEILDTCLLQKKVEQHSPSQELRKNDYWFLVLLLFLPWLLIFEAAKSESGKAVRITQETKKDIEEKIKNLEEMYKQVS